jgi:hypothetical protein
MTYAEATHEVVGKSRYLPLCDSQFQRDMQLAKAQLGAVAAQIGPVSDQVKADIHLVYARAKAGAESITRLQNDASAFCQSEDAKALSSCLNKGKINVTLHENGELTPWIFSNETAKQAYAPAVGGEGLATSSVGGPTETVHFDPIKGGSNSLSESLATAECIGKIKMTTVLGTKTKSTAQKLRESLLKKCVPDILMDEETKKFCSQE